MAPPDLGVELPAEGSRYAERNLRANTVSLIAAQFVTGLFGLAFWIVAARLFPPHEVGVAAALITSAAMLSTLAVLSIDTLYERFLPLAGHLAGPLLKYGYLVVSVAALLAGTALVVFGPRHELFETGWGMALYPVLVLVLAVFTLQDKVTVGLGVARWAAAKNAAHAVAKLVALVALAAVGGAVSIVAAWGTTAAVAVVCILIAVRYRYRSHPRFLEKPTLPSRRELWSYFGSSFGITTIWAIGPLLVPLIVVARLGAEANAHFAVSWAIVNALYFMVHLAISPYVAEAAANPDKIASLSWRMVRMVGVVSCIGSLGLLIVGPLVLGVVGPEYRAEGQGFLYLAAAFVPLSAIGAVYEGFARVQRRLGLLMVVLCLSTFVIVVGSLIGVRALGIVGVGWAYLVAESLTALLLFIPAVRWFRRAVATNSSGEPS